MCDIMRKVMVMAFSNRLRELRKKKRMTQEMLATQINVAVSSVTMWELGERMPSIEKLQKLAELFQVSTDFLLDSSSCPQDPRLDDVHFRISFESLTPEHQQEVISFLEFLKIKEAQNQAEEAKQKKNS